MIQSWLRTTVDRILHPEGLSARVLGPVALAAFALLFLGTTTSWLVHRSGAIHSARERAGSVAASVALGIDGARHESWATALPNAGSLMDWRSAPQELRNLRTGMGKTLLAAGMSRPITTLRVRESARNTILTAPHKRHDGALEQMVSTASPPSWREKTAYLPQMESALQDGEPSTSGVRQGTRGRSVLAWAPIQDGFGAVVGLVQTEVPVDAVLAANLRTHLLLALIAGAALATGILVGLRRSSQATEAMAALTATALEESLEEPYLPSDPSRELVELATALEERRGIESGLRAALAEEATRSGRALEVTRRALAARDRHMGLLSARYPAPLRTVAGAIGRVPAKAVPPAERARLRQAVLASCDLARALDQVGELGRLACGERPLERLGFGLRPAINRALTGVRERAAAADVDLRVVIGDGLPGTVVGDEPVLVRALTLLTDNAVQSTAKGGGGTVSLRINRIDGALGGAVRFELCDGAPSLSDVDRANLFRAFVPEGVRPPRDRDPLDLSMPIAGRLLALLGSEPVVEGTPGSGTRIAFVVRFESQDSSPVNGIAGAIPNAAFDLRTQASAIAAHTTPSAGRPRLRL